MRILANENIPRDTVEALRQRGHDVTWVHTNARGSTDREVRQRAVSNWRVLVTFDKDFGELAVRQGLPAATGIVLLRLQAPDPSSLTRLIVAALESRDDWAGHFSVVERDRVRMIALPQATE